MPDETPDNPAADAGAHAAHVADRAPTAEEERVAEQVAKDVPETAGEHFAEMAEVGADVKGEGQIEP